MNTLEDSLVRRLIMLLSYILLQPAAMLDDREKSQSMPLWLRFSMRLKVNLDRDQLGLVAAGVAFYFLLAAFPAIAVIVSLYALIADPADIIAQISILARFLPHDALAILTDQATQLASAPQKALSLSLIFSLLFTLYVASKGMRVLIKGFNIAYDYEERRNIVWRTLLAYAMTIGMIVYMIASLALIAGVPAFLQLMPFPDMLSAAYVGLRWPALFFMALVGLEFLYTYGPSMPVTTKRTGRVVSIGSFTATALWVTASAGFSLFVTHFGRYNETYGSLSAVVVLLLWFWLSALMMMLGAEINAAYEKEKGI